MPCLFDKLTFSLFGSNNHVPYDQQKSLKTNFLQMCRLPLHKVRSQETEILIQLLATCRLYSTDVTPSELDSKKRMHDIAVLEFANHAILKWYEKRQQRSSRVSFIKRYQQTIQRLKHDLIELDRQDFLNRRAKHSCWTNPLYNAAMLQSYLSPKQKQYWDAQQTSDIEATATETTPLLRQKHGKLFYAVSLPLFNWLTEMNIVDCLCDSLNICTDLIRVF